VYIFACFTPFSCRIKPVEQLWLNIKQRYLSNMAFKDYEDIVDKCCDAWNDILKKDNFVKKLCKRSETCKNIHN
jgi:transposase